MCFWKLREKLICLVNYMLCTINVHYYFLNLYNHIKFLLLIPSQIPTLQLFTIVIGSYYLLYNVGLGGSYDQTSFYCYTSGSLTRIHWLYCPQTVAPSVRNTHRIEIQLH